MATIRAITKRTIFAEVVPGKPIRFCHFALIQTAVGAAVEQLQLFHLHPLGSSNQSMAQLGASEDDFIRVDEISFDYNHLDPIATFNRLHGGQCFPEVTKYPSEA